MEWISNPASSTNQLCSLSSLPDSSGLSFPALEDRIPFTSWGCREPP